MADNVVLDAGAGGSTVRTLEDGSSVHWPVGVVAYATAVSTPDVLTIPIAAALADNTANPTTLLGGSCLMVFDGSTWDRAPGNATDGLLVNLGANNDVTISGSVTVATHDVTNAGTFAVQAAQSGTWNITNVSGTISLPTGAATAAKQPALGIAGTASTDVITVQGIAGGTALPVSVSGTVTVGSHAVTNAGTFLVQAEQSGAWSLTNISGTITLPTGAATAARQDTGNTALAAIQTAAEILDNAISGTEMQVDVVAALPAGTNNIGDVDVLSIAAGDNNIGNVDLASAIPAGTNLIGRVSSSAETSAIYEGTTALTPKFAKIDAASSGDNTLVAAVASKKIRVLALFAVAAGAVDVRFESGASGTALTGQMTLTTNSGFVLPFNPAGWFETGVNTLLNLELSGAVSVDGCITYVEAS